jgi:KDO2-lipid IV(A) lauroyltransferase
MGRTRSVAFKAGDYLAPRYWPMWITIGLLRLAALLPYPAAVRTGRLLGSLVYRLSPRRHAVVDANLEHCFPEKSRDERERIKRETYRNIGLALIEMAMCWWWSDERLEPLVEIEGKENLDAVLGAGQGAILLSGHFTSLEIGGRLLSMFLPFQTIYRTQRNDLFDSYLYSKRSSYLVRVVSRKDMRRLIKGIRDGIPTWYAPDQNFHREQNVFAPFLGVQAATITAGSRLAEATGAAMLPYYPERKRDGSGYRLIIGKPLENFPSGDEVIDATAINASIGEFVRMDPGNYMWIHERFKTRPPGAEPIYK